MLEVGRPASELGTQQVLGLLLTDPCPRDCTSIGCDAGRSLVDVKTFGLLWLQMDVVPKGFGRVVSF